MFVSMARLCRKNSVSPLQPRICAPNESGTLLVTHVDALPLQATNPDIPPVFGGGLVYVRQSETPCYERIQPQTRSGAVVFDLRAVEGRLEGSKPGLGIRCE